MTDAGQDANPRPPYFRSHAVSRKHSINRRQCRGPPRSSESSRASVRLGHFVLTCGLFFYLSRENVSTGRFSVHLGRPLLASNLLLLVKNCDTKLFKIQPGGRLRRVGVHKSCINTSNLVLHKVLRDKYHRMGMVRCFKVPLRSRQQCCYLEKRVDVKVRRLVLFLSPVHPAVDHALPRLPPEGRLLLIV